MTDGTPVQGRATRFLYLVLSFWVAGRAATLVMDQEKGRPSPQLQVADGTANSSQGAKALVRGSPAQAFKAATAHVPQRRASFSAALPPVSGGPTISPARPLLIASALAQPRTGAGILHQPPGVPTGPVSPPDGGAAAPMNRWSLSAWMLVRPDNHRAGLASAGQLGGSQVGARLAYDLIPVASGSLAIHGRISSALQSPEAVEAALGLSYRPSQSLPISIAAERRIALADGARNAFAIYAAGGIGPTPFGSRLDVEGYAQAGVVGAARTDAFADGRIALSTSLADIRPGTLKAGLSLSGGAQPGLSRLDAGPHISGRIGHARAVLEWRERVAGHALPGSGPALILAADF